MSATVKTKCSFISIIGAPNAGKSTLLNKLVGSKVSIVTPKVQTTRTRITGIVIEGNSQLVFIDTPGIFIPKKRLDRAMVKTAWDCMKSSDFTVFIVDCKKNRSDEVKNIMLSLSQRAGRKILLLNKIDLVRKDRLLALTGELNKDGIFEKTFMISAISGDGIDDFKKYLAENAEDSPFMYPEDQISDVPIRMLAAEITREKLMFRLENELPYHLMVETEKWEDNKNGIKINQIIYVTSESHKKIIVGKGGQTIKEIGEKARKEITRVLGQKVHLFLFVKVKSNWQDSRDNYLSMGLDFGK